MVVEEDKSYGKMLGGKIESFLKMLAKDNEDEIILCICKIIHSFIGCSFFNRDKIDHTNRQIWGILDKLDDISISARDTLHLLL